MSVIETRSHQMFPVLDAGQIETAKRFASGPARDFAPGEVVFDAGVANAPAWLVLKGSIDVVRRDGLMRETAITSHHAGQFSGEVSQLAGRQSLAGGRAGTEGCTALPIDAAHVRALLIGSAEIGEIMMRAFILRRVGLLESGGVGSVLVGEPGTPDLIRLQGFLARNGYPCTVLDATNADGRAVVERFGVLPDELPIMLCPNGTLLRRPTNGEAPVVWASRRRSIPTRSTTSPWSAQDPRGSPLPSTPRWKACPCWYSTSARLGGRPEHPRGSRTIWDFPPAYRAWRWPGAPSIKR